MPFPEGLHAISRRSDDRDGYGHGMGCDNEPVHPDGLLNSFQRAGRMYLCIQGPRSRSRLPSLVVECLLVWLMTGPIYKPATAVQEVGTIERDEGDVEHLGIRRACVWRRQVVSVG